MTGPDPRRTWLLLVGTSTGACDKSLPPLPGVAGNLGGLLTVLTDSLGFALRQNTTVIHDPDEPTVIEEALLDLADRDADTILFYFAGHGLLDDCRDLYLATSRSSAERPQLRSLPFTTVRRTVANARAAKRLVVLDCCYSGRAIAAMGANKIHDTDVEVSGSYTLTSTSANAPAHAPVGAAQTAFTGALLEVLCDGEPDGPELLDLATVYTAVSRRLRAAGKPTPRQQNTDSVLGLVFGPNAAWRRRPHLAACGVPDLEPSVRAEHVETLDGGGNVLSVCYAAGTTPAAVVANAGSVANAQRAGDPAAEADGSPLPPGLASRTADAVGLNRIHAVLWTGSDTPIVYPSMPFPHAEATFQFVAPATGVGYGDLILFSAGTWHRLALSDGSISGPSRQSSARILAARWAHLIAAYKWMRWTVSIGQQSLLVALGMMPDVSRVKELRNQSLLSVLPKMFLPLANTLASSVLSVYDADTHKLLGRIILDVNLSDVLQFRTLANHQAALVARTSDDRRPLRRILVDLRARRVVADDPVAADPIRRLHLTTATRPRIRLSEAADHIAVSVPRSARTLVYAINGRGSAANVPGVHAGWSRSGTTIAVCDSTSMTILDAGTGVEVATVTLPVPVTGDPVFAADGTRIAVPAGQSILVVSVSATR